MLTKQDLQNIGQIVDERINQRLEQRLTPLVDDMRFIKESLRGLKMKTTHIQNTLSVAIRVFDRNHNENQKRIKKIEDHLELAVY